MAQILDLSNEYTKQTIAEKRQEAFQYDEPDAGGEHVVIDGLTVLILQDHLHLVQLRPVRTPTGGFGHPDVIFENVVHP